MPSIPLPEGRSVPTSLSPFLVFANHTVKDSPQKFSKLTVVRLGRLSFLVVGICRFALDFADEDGVG